ELLAAMHYPGSVLNNADELGMLILEIEAAIDLEGLAELPLVKAVRREAKLQVDERPSEDSNAENPREGKPKKDKLQGYKYAWIQSLNNHVFVLARICPPVITRMSMQEQKDWSIRAACNYLQNWTIPEEKEEDINDSRVAAGLLLLRAYRVRYFLLQGHSLEESVPTNMAPPTERAIRQGLSRWHLMNVLKKTQAVQDD
ncbi:MAG: hypothetical protein Q9180_008612, partial [Flavoplaca navasiana]